MSISGHALKDSRMAWSIILGIGGLIVTVLLAYWPTWIALWRPHGYFVSVLSVCLLLSARTRLANAPIKPLTWTLPLLVLCAIAAVLFWRSGIPALQLLMLPLLILLGVLAGFGAAVTYIVAVPIAFLYFAAPVWNVVLTSPLQDLTVWVTRILAVAGGLPATFHGNLIQFPNGITFEISEWCSGAGFLMQGLAVAMLLGELEQASLARRLRLLLSIALVALAANWIRVLLIIELGYWSGMRSMLATSHHVAFGYALFVLALALFVWLATRRPVLRAAPIAAQPPLLGAWRPGGAYGAVVISLISVAAVMSLLASPLHRVAKADSTQRHSFGFQHAAGDSRRTMTSDRSVAGDLS
jgi:exosortase